MFISQALPGTTKNIKTYLKKTVLNIMRYSQQKYIDTLTRNDKK